MLVSNIFFFFKTLVGEDEPIVDEHIFEMGLVQPPRAVIQASNVLGWQALNQRAPEVFLFQDIFLGLQDSSPAKFVGNNSAKIDGMVLFMGSEIRPNQQKSHLGCVKFISLYFPVFPCERVRVNYQ